MERLLKKGDVFVLAQGHLAGEYVVSCIEETAISTSPIYENRVWCLQVENPEKGISFYQSDAYTPCVGVIKVIGHATQATPGKWDVKYFDKNEYTEITFLDGTKIKVDKNKGVGAIIANAFKENTKSDGVKWEKTEKMGGGKTNDFDYAEIMKDAIDEVVKNAIESTAHKIIKEFREGIKKVIGN